MTQKPEVSDYHRDAGKARVDLLPPLALLAVAQVLTYGAEKYSDRNWEHYAGHWNLGQLVGSALRHIFRWMAGEDRDSRPGESGLHHLAHAACDLLMVLELHFDGSATDDRTRLCGITHMADLLEYVKPAEDCR